MGKVLFLQSDVENPYIIYRKMLEESPVYWDETQRIWGVYAYDACQMLLNSSAAVIPQQNNAATNQMNEYSQLLLQHLARLNNPPQHQMARMAAAELLHYTKPVDIQNILFNLLNNATKEIDWVATIAKQLPIIALLKSFDFQDDTINVFLQQIDHLVKIMLPQKSVQQIHDVNAVSKDLYLLTEQHILHTNLAALLHEPAKHDQVPFYVCNLIGLVIQSYDAGRGILSNALLQILINKVNIKEKESIQNSVIETLRYDPPVHNTRRILNEDVIIENKTLKKGDTVVLVLAAANRDANKFNHPDQFDITRVNNNDHLTFGAGIHTCVARHYAMQMATETLYHLFNQYKNIQLLEYDISYEPLVNVRLLKHLFITL